MAETELTRTTAANKWSAAGVAMTMTAIDNTNGNKFTSAIDQVVLVQNPTAGALTFQMTSQPLRASGRSGNVSQSIAAGEIRAFRVTQDGWEDANGNVLIPSGVSASLKVGILTLG